MADQTPHDDDECWARYEVAIGPPPGASARIRARVDRAVAQRSDLGAAQPRAPRAAAVILLMKSSAMAAAFSVAAIAGVDLGARAIWPAPAELPTHTATAAASSQPSASTPPRIEPASMPNTTMATMTEPTMTPRPSPPSLTATRPAVPRPDASATASNSPPLAVDDPLAHETNLVAHARADLDRGALGDALRQFAEHAARFPNGVLAPERDAFAAIARCRRKADAAILTTFAAAYPRSPYLGRVREACRSSSTDRTTPPE